MDTKSHCVYLLTSDDPQCRDYFYIGYTDNPLKRLRQHNGELTNGANQTKRKGRPWSLVCFVSGFLDHRTALGFEWSWQHPHDRKGVKEALVLKSNSNSSSVSLSSLHRIYHAVAVLHILLRVDPYCNMRLRLNVLQSERLTAYCRAVQMVPHPLLSTPLSTGALLSVHHVSVEDVKALLRNVGDAADDSLRNTQNEQSGRLLVSGGCGSNEDLADKSSKGLLACTLCGLPVEYKKAMLCQRDYNHHRAPPEHVSSCTLVSHIHCLAMWFQFEFSRQSSAGQPPPAPLLLPGNESCNCPLCDFPLLWGVGILHLRQRCNTLRDAQLQRRKVLFETQLRDRLAEIDGVEPTRPNCKKRPRGDLASLPSGTLDDAVQGSVRAS